AHIEETYNKLAVGDEIKLGLRRNKDMLIETLIKADPDSLPALTMIQRQEYGSSIASALLDIGLILTENDGKITIDDIVQELAGGITGGPPERGDVIQKIQGQTITDPGQLPQICSKIKTGEKVELVLFRNGAEVPISYMKQGCENGKPLLIKK
ncbi:MAG: hypothetical protein JSV44_03965, partial [Candidatus Zixiibacteriota bacterium]